MAFKWISELFYNGATAADDFIEITFDAGTDVTNFTLTTYGSGGGVRDTVSLNGLTPVTIDGQDVYKITGSDLTRNFKPGNAVSIDDNGTVVQFVSFGGTVTATEGAASGTTSTDIGAAATGESLNSINGSTYHSDAPTPNDQTPTCFLAGTSIATQNGEVAIEDLAAGDQIALQSGGFATLRWVGYSDTDASGENHAAAAPICIPAHAFGADMPKRDLYVSPNHRIWLNHAALELHFATNEVLVAAKHLVGWRGITQVTDVPSPRYFHMLFDQHEIVISDGLPTESFHPAAIVTTRFERETREELLALFPELDSMALQNTTAANLCLKAYEVPVAMKAIAA